MGLGLLFLSAAVQPGCYGAAARGGPADGAAGADAAARLDGDTPDGATPDAAGGIAGGGDAGSGGSGGRDADTDVASVADTGRGAVVGAACTSAADCEGGFCVDGVCCDARCDGSCQSCAVRGRVGLCSPVRNEPDDTCAGDSTCDRAGVCRRALGAACAAAGACASGHCVDGVCCATASCGRCASCARPGAEGWCADVPRFTDDVDSACAGGLTCDGAGTCRARPGQACAGPADCASGFCADGVCCDQACDATCFRCDQPGQVGLCRALDGAPDLAASTPCAGDGVCRAGADGAPACKVADGGPCDADGACANGSCLTIHVDADGDGYGGVARRICAEVPPPGHVRAGGDCCDADPDAHPGPVSFKNQRNACGGWDWNCNGAIETLPGRDGERCGCPDIGRLLPPVACGPCR